jgi:hypothetical protein
MYSQTSNTDERAMHLKLLDFKTGLTGLKFH